MWLFPSQPHGRKTARFQYRLGANPFVHALSRTSCQPKSASITIQNACLHLHGSKLASSTCQVDASNKSRGVWFSGNIAQDRFSCSCTSKNRYSLNLGNQQMHPWADFMLKEGNFSYCFSSCLFFSLRHHSGIIFAQSCSIYTFASYLNLVSYQFLQFPLPSRYCFWATHPDFRPIPQTPADLHETKRLLNRLTSLVWLVSCWRPWLCWPIQQLATTFLTAKATVGFANDTL